MNMSPALKTELSPKLEARLGKARLLDELCEDFGYDRNYAGRLLRTAQLRPRPSASVGGCGRRVVFLD